jgi:hypothetical protein
VLDITGHKVASSVGQYFSMLPALAEDLGRHSERFVSFSLCMNGSVE